MIPKFPGEAPRDLSRPLEELKLRIDERAAGQRLDKALQIYLPWRSRTSVRKLIDEGRIQIGGRGARRPAQRVQLGDVVRVEIPPRPDLEALAKVEVELSILHEDRWMVAVDKPPGMAVHPAGRTLEGTLIHHLHRRYPRSGGAGDVVPRLLHRIDRETSGVVAVGLDEQFHSLVARQFEDRLVHKTYLAVVHGCPAERQGAIEFGIGPDRRSRVRLKLEARRDGSGLPSRTEYRVVRGGATYSLVELTPQTGRTHQIRVHMAAIGHPLVGDKIYGPDERYFLEHLEGRLSEEARERLVLERHALHSHRLRFHHPFLDEEMELEAALPSDLEDLVR